MIIKIRAMIANLEGAKYSQPDKVTPFLDGVVYYEKSISDNGMTALPPNNTLSYFVEWP